MTSCHCSATDQQFDRRIAEKDLKRFRRRGPDPATGMLIEQIARAPLPEEATLLDIGGGVGVIQHALLDHGLAHATQIDASGAYLTISAEEAERRGHADRSAYLHGDFRGLAPTTPPADVVTMDRVVCCDPDYRTLLSAAAQHARTLLALTYPHDRWYTRLFVALANTWRKLTGSSFRAYIHRPDAMHAVLEQSGLRLQWAGGTVVWRAEVFGRA